MSPSSLTALVVHGGAWAIPDDAVDQHRRGVLASLEQGWARLRDGGSAVDAVEAAVRVLEDDPTFDAGTGSMLNLEGHVEMDAILVRGQDLEVGAVAAVRRVRNPIGLARRVLENSEHALLVGAGAHRFAREQGVEEVAEEDLLVGRERQRLEEMKRHGHKAESFFRGPSRGTVGAVALDAAGHLAAATSTGGTPGKYPGRVGDSPLLGCGCYCDDGAGGASATGYGESLLRATLCRDAARMMEDGMAAADAASASIARLHSRFAGHGGVILIDGHGRIGHAHNTPRMALAGRREGQEPFSSV
jgi:beta-aspartyl-peptidase (threonine type)